MQPINLADVRDHRARERQRAQLRPLWNVMGDIMQHPDLDALRATFTPCVGDPKAEVILSIIDWAEHTRARFAQLDAWRHQGGAQ